MGLDMYIYADRYVGGWDHGTDEEKKKYTQIIQSVGMGEMVSKHSPHAHVRATVAYWRKANAIHSWFVQELQDGVDECQSTLVSTEDMAKLIAKCEAALQLYKEGKIEAAGECMTPAAGFFFGSTEVDDWWVEGLKDTIEQLTPLIKFGNEFEFYYRASW